MKPGGMKPGWMDFAAVKARVSIGELLAWHGLAIPAQAVKWRGRCPVHGGQGEQSFHVHLSRNVFHCFACGANGDVLDLAVALEGGTLAQAARRLDDRFSSSPSRWPVQPQCAPGVRTVTKGRQRLAPLRFQLKGVRPDHPWIASRGIHPETAAVFGVGVYSGRGLMRNRCVIPIHDDQGRLVAYAGRSLGQAQPRYLFPSGFAKSGALFNFHRASAECGHAVIVVEGFFDCMRVWQAGHRATVALMGVAMSQDQQLLLTSRFRRVVLMLDGDDAGRNAARKLAARLRPYVEVRLVHLPEGSQPDKASDLEINNFLSEPSEGRRLFTQTA